MPIATLNPATGELLRIFDSLEKNEIEERLSRAEKAFRMHRLSSFESRAISMRKAGNILLDEKVRFATLMTLEMGKPVTAAIAEAEKCATACFYYADNAERLLASYAVPSSGGEATVHFQPLGPVLAVMPWNFPFWQVFRFVAPTLMAGNVGLLKHSSNVP